ncbi:hypothetical protein JB92DRAFT_2838082 [Gautieria morchelliformis]|nr:hypothetical protein JB92DRAFT_2838082 [Gautieria morchelliformis]
MITVTEVHAPGTNNSTKWARAFLLATVVRSPELDPTLQTPAVYIVRHGLYQINVLCEVPFVRKSSPFERAALDRPNALASDEAHATHLLEARLRLHWQDDVIRGLQHAVSFSKGGTPLPSYVMIPRRCHWQGGIDYPFCFGAWNPFATDEECRANMYLNMSIPALNQHEVAITYTEVARVPPDADHYYHSHLSTTSRKTDGHLMAYTPIGGELCLIPDGDWDPEDEEAESLPRGRADDVVREINKSSMTDHQIQPPLPKILKADECAQGLPFASDVNEPVGLLGGQDTLKVTPRSSR